MLKRIITVVLMLSVCAFSVESMAAISMPEQNKKDNQPKTYTEENTSIIVTPDQPQFYIKLKSNPTTGYSWSLREFDSSLIQAGQHQYFAPLNDLVGASGFDKWTFKVNPSAFTTPHQIDIRMVYARPWEKDDSGKQVVFHITTQAK